MIKKSEVSFQGFKYSLMRASVDTPSRITNVSLLNEILFCLFFKQLKNTFSEYPLSNLVDILL